MKEASDVKALENSDVKAVVENDDSITPAQLHMQIELSEIRKQHYLQQIDDPDLRQMILAPMTGEEVQQKS